jgi:hypothetical protein
MSKKLLYHLNGEKTGAFRKWLDNFNGEPRIAWYPSAGEDFRDLLYLSPKYSEINPASQPEPLSPDIFLHTDYFPWGAPTFLDNQTIRLDDHTNISAKSIEELPRCDLPLDPRIVDFPKGSIATGRVLFLEVDVQSDVLGNFSCPVVYAFVENAAFCSEKIIPQQGRLSHVVHVRYSGAGGGGTSTGIWLLNILSKVNCEVFVSDGKLTRASGDKRVYELYPTLAGKEDESQLKPIRTIRSVLWSDNGDVSWNIL